MDNQRTAYAADLVVLLRPYANDGRCGIAWIGGYQTQGNMSTSTDFGYSVVAPNCSDYTLLHEIGHNLGLGHSRAETPEGGSFPYGVGYGKTADFVTVMASPSHFSAPRLPQLSSPTTNCNGSPCGVSYNNATNGADAVQAIRQTMEQVASYKP